MKNRELFDKANADNDLNIKEKLRNDYADWCKKNGRTKINAQSTIDFLEEDVH